MLFHPTGLAGAVLIEIERHEDRRGYFSRSFCRREFLAAGLPGDFPQQNLSFNLRSGTIRGMHYQRAPYGEGKLIRCTRGAILDVIVDLRVPGLGGDLAWRAFSLDPDRGQMLYVPPGFAHGFQTLVDQTEVSYQMTEFHRPGVDTGFRWDDPYFNLRWPLPVRCISERDAGYPDFVPGAVPAI